MKKALSLFLALVMCLSLCACGGENSGGNKVANNKAVIITNEGKSIAMSAEELFKEFDGNEARFKKLYGGASITFTGTVKSIRTGTSVLNGEGGVTANENKIVFEEGWCVIIGKSNTSCDLADFYPGQKLEVTTGILTAAYDTEFLQEVAEHNRVVWLLGNDKLGWGDVYNSQTTTIKPVE